MRLLHFNDDASDRDRVTLTEFSGDNIPRYAVLSHMWGAEEEEVSFTDMMENTGQHKSGYDKIRFCGEKANEQLQYFWLDTCCIDKSNNLELQDAINAMFHWYRQAAICYVYLSDVSREGSDFSCASWERSRWFTRGWTLQELLAPKTVEFFSADGEYLGNRQSQAPRLYKATRIHGQALHGRAVSDFSIKERLRWAERRNTTREEDTAYCLLGLFGIEMPLAYGEGRQHALMRLQERIIESQSSKGYIKPVVRSITRFIRGRSDKPLGKMQIESHEAEVGHPFISVDYSPVLMPAFERLNTSTDQYWSYSFEAWRDSELETMLAEPEYPSPPSYPVGIPV